MDKNSLNTNKQFMIGNGMLAFGVFAVIIIFLYMSFRFQRKADKVQTYEGVYNIELTNTFDAACLCISSPFINACTICSSFEICANTLNSICE